MTVVRKLVWLIIWVSFPVMPISGAEPKNGEVPANAGVSYYRQVRPIFQQHCQGCHQPARAQGDYVMTNHAAMLQGGKSGDPAIVVGDPGRSKLVQQITHQNGKPPEMPKNKPPLTDADVNLIKSWIQQGAKDDSPASVRTVVDTDHPPHYVLPPVITSLAYSPDGQWLAVTGYHEVLLHKADGSGLAARLVGLSERIQSLAFSPNGKFLAVTGGDPGRCGEVQIWDVAKKNLKLSVSVTFDTLYGARWSPDGNLVSFGCGDNTLRVIDARDGKQVLFQGAHNDWVLETVFSTDGSHLVSVSRDMSMKLTEVATQRFVDNITSITPGALKGGLMTVDRHPRRDELLIGGSDGVPKIYQMYRTKKRVIGDDFNFLRGFEAMPGRIFSARYSADGSRIVVGSSFDGKGEVRVYHSGVRDPDPQFIKLSGLPVVSTKGLTTLALLPDYRPSTKMISRFDGQRGPVYAVAFRPDGNHVASAGFDGVVRLNDPNTGKLIKEFVPVDVKATGLVTSTGGK